MSGNVDSMAAPRPRRARRQGLWRLVVLVVILFIIGGYVSPIRSFIERTNQIEGEKALTEDLRIEHENLTRELESLQDQKYVEQVARQDLGLVKPGEQSYVVKDLENSKVSSSDPLVEETGSEESTARPAAEPDLMPLLP